MSAVTSEGITLTVNPLSLRDLGRAMIAGAFVGVCTWLVYIVLGAIVLGQLVCGSGVASCASSEQYGLIGSIVVGSAIGVTVLLRQRVARPLIVVAAAGIALWDIVRTLGTFDRPVSLVVTVCLYAVAYGLFAWLMRIRNVWVLGVGVVVLLVLARLV